MTEKNGKEVNVMLIKVEANVDDCPEIQEEKRSK